MDKQRDDLEIVILLRSFSSSTKQNERLINVIPLH